MKKYISVFLLATVIAMAQTTQTLDLQGCINLAIQNSYSLKNAKIDQRVATAKVGEVRAMGLPQLDGQVQLTHNDPLQPLFYRNSPNGFFPYNPEKGPVDKMDNFFQLPAALNLSLSASWLALSSSYFVGLQAAKTYKELSLNSSNLTQAQLVQNVSKAYYMVLTTEERMKQLDKNISRLDTTFVQTKALQEKGFVEKLDVQRLEVALNNIKTEREKVKALTDLGYALLKFQMQVPQTETIALKESVADINTELSPINSANVSYENRYEYQSLLTAQKLNRLDKKNVMLAPLPTLVFFANGGTLTSNIEVADLFKKESPWGKYFMFGATLKVSIFGSGRQHYVYQQSRLRVEKSNNDLENFKQAADFQAKNAVVNYNNSVITLGIRKKNLDLAQEVVNQTKIKYTAGVGSNLELITAEADFRDAQSEYYVALGEALSAKVDYDYAVGNLK